MECIAFDSHKHYTWASVEDPTGSLLFEGRILHRRDAIRWFLAQWTPGSPVALETIGNWYWIVQEIEEAGMIPQLTHARKAKVMMGLTNKTDKLDARGMNRLQRTGTLPTVWIPPAELRDQRELPRTRMVLAHERTRLKNRIHATLAKYALSAPEVSDLFSPAQRQALTSLLAQLPLHTRYAAEQLLVQLDLIQQQIKAFEIRMKEAFRTTPELELLMSTPGVGFILGIVITSEVGDVHRFPSAGHLASYAGTTPRVHSSGGKTRFGPLRPDVNRYLKWAFMEAANVVSVNRKAWAQRHAVQLYQRLRLKKGHATAVGAVARHLAEATFWMLTRQETYREPHSSPAASMEG